MTSARIALAAGLWLGLTPPALAADDAARLGHRLAQIKCASCHLVDNRLGSAPARPRRVSPNRSAPPFQILAMTYEPSDLEEALAEGIVVAHNTKGDPEMPEFALTPREAGALVAYLRSLRAR